MTGAQSAAALAGALGRPVRWKTIEAARSALMRPHTGDQATDHFAGLHAATAHSRPRRPPTPP